MVELQRMSRLPLGGTIISLDQKVGLTVASKISWTPYCPVVSIKSRANAIPGKIFAKKINYRQSPHLLIPLDKKEKVPR